MYQFLEEHFDGQRYGHWHENIPPHYTFDYFKFATIRNPYTRFASAWYYVSDPSSQYIEIYERLMGHSMEILYFLEWLNEEKENLYYMRDDQDRPYQLSTILMPQYLNVEQRLAGVKIDRFIKLENILEEVNMLPFVNRHVHSLPHLHIGDGSTYKKWNELKTPTILQLVNQIFDKDFDMFGYTKELT